MTKIPNPNGAGDSILFAWCPDVSPQSCIYRLDPNGVGGYTRVNEICLGNYIENYLRTHNWFVLTAYNDMLPVIDPATNETVHIIGCESYIGQVYSSISGFYPGAMYAIRSSNGSYRIKEVNGRWYFGKPSLLSTRAYTPSPFNEDNGNTIYFGGWDCNDRIFDNSAWIFNTTLEEALK
jgi:hypothetical protein